ncbi:haloacid dehalogenase type II [Tunturibacter empetritectus]|uniref:2-haloacid dehalogenase n=1 Tax=Tunturiibacter empetritectus TaxID=3069691 RepID=A0A7W8IGW7_9BACT|nr:haloacid dehalogenase type II [Edaphobacter lichenicola]MBB5316981.1 2-haloacid dehalogenase [Edaphobacter lichenicola]
MSMVAGAATAISTESMLAALPKRKIKAIALDGLAVFDTRPVAALTERTFPGRGDEITALWRKQQFEYTWLRTLGRRYVDFLQVTEEALRFACRSLRLELAKADSDRLMQSYLELKAWPDALQALRALKAGGLRMAFLSNFSATMLDCAVRNSGLEGLFESHLTTDRVRAFKPDPQAYEMATSAFGLQKKEIVFAAFGGWDAVGAKWFGYPTFWVNRAQAATEELDVLPDGAGKDLNDLAAFVLDR